MKYLASPYSDPNPFVRERRYLTAMETLHHLLVRGIWVYAPIVHCHELAKVAGLPKDHEFWLAYDMEMISVSDGVIVLTMDGWKESVGLNKEIEFAKKTGKPIEFLEPIS